MSKNIFEAGWSFFLIQSPAITDQTSWYIELPAEEVTGSKKKFHVFYFEHKVIWTVPEVS